MYLDQARVSQSDCEADNLRNFVELFSFAENSEKLCLVDIFAVYLLDWLPQDLLSHSSRHRVFLLCLL